MCLRQLRQDIISALYDEAASRRDPARRVIYQGLFLTLTRGRWHLVRRRDVGRSYHGCTRHPTLNLPYLVHMIVRLDRLWPIIQALLQVVERDDYDGEVVKGALNRCLFDNGVGHFTTHLVYGQRRLALLLDLV